MSYATLYEKLYAKLGNNCSNEDESVLTSNQKFIPLDSTIYNVYSTCPIRTTYSQTTTGIPTTIIKKSGPKKSQNTIMRIIKGNI
jgi:hypothetical protein